MISFLSGFTTAGLILFALVFIIFCTGTLSLAARMHGHGNDADEPNPWPKWCKIAAKVIYGLAFGLKWALVFWPYGLVRGGLSAWGLSKGHGNVYGMKGVKIGNDKPEALEAITRPVYQAFGGNIYKPGYSWFFMGFKGLLIGDVLVALVWPLGYHLGWKTKIDGGVEWISGGLAGFVLAIETIAICLILAAVEAKAPVVATTLAMIL